jgi:hypothetical protein
VEGPEVNLFNFRRLQFKSHFGRCLTHSAAISQQKGNLAIRIDNDTSDFQTETPDNEKNFYFNLVQTLIYSQGPKAIICYSEARTRAYFVPESETRLSYPVASSTATLYRQFFEIIHTIVYQQKTFKRTFDLIEVYDDIPTSQEAALFSILPAGNHLKLYIKNQFDSSKLLD